MANENHKEPIVFITSLTELHIYTLSYTFSYQFLPTHIGIRTYNYMCACSMSSICIYIDTWAF